MNTKFHPIITVILILLTVASARSIYSLRKSMNRLDTAKDELAKAIQEGGRLIGQIEYVRSDEYIEKSAVEKLNLTKPGYKILIINEKKPEDVNPDLADTPQAITPNWLLWLEKFGLDSILL